MTVNAAGQRSFLPLCLIALAAAILSVQFLLTKKLTLDNVPVFQIVACRGAVQALGCFTCFVYMRRPLRTCLGESGEQTLWLCVCGFLCFTGAAFAFAAVSLLNLAEMQVLLSSTPVITALCAWVLLGERWHWNEFTSAGTTILGVLVVAMPGLLVGDATFSGQWHSWRHVVGVLFTLSNSASSALNFSCVRILGTRVKAHFLVVTMVNGLAQFVFGILASFVMGFLTGKYPVWLSRDDWLFVLAVGFLSISSQGCTIWGMQREKSALGSVVLQGLGPVCAFLLQIVFLPSEPIVLSTLFGFAVIFVGLVVAVYGKWHRERQEQRVLPMSEPNSSSPCMYEKLQG